MSLPIISNGQPTAPRRKHGARRTRLVFALAFVVAVICAVVLAPVWYPLIATNEDSLFAFQRTQRALRWSLGQPMPSAPDTTRLPQRLAEKGMTEGAPILIRIFKRDFELELWMKRDGVFQRFATYPICRWSGTLGPKLRQGDGQAPEGFYSVNAGALNPNSRWFRSFNLGYPNVFDAANGRTGSLIMVHGGCASVGCFAMTNAQMAEIWQLVTAALQGGQKRFQVQVYPFRLTGDALEPYASSPDLAFWQTLKRGSDLFEASHLPPRVTVCKGSYTFEPAGVYLNGDGGIENRCLGLPAKS